MQWLDEKLHDPYSLVGEVTGNVAKLSIVHPGGEKIVRTKYMQQPDIDNATSDDIRIYFSKIIGKLRMKTKEQLDIYILNDRDIKT